jgi:glyoxylase-like metal-dependent hydrolase (beta-lactamase superfamily II)
MIKQITPNIWQFTFEQFGSCVYLIKLNNKNILIDTSTLQNRTELTKDLKSLNLIAKSIDFVFLTHGHFDHIENLDIFTNAEFYGDKKDFKNYDKIKDIRGQPFNEIKDIETPGHTFGSVCFYMPKEKILFSGDTIFHNGDIGRTDFPNSSKKDMKESLNILKKFDYKILCPGHD